ncbi:MAG: DUF3280 domain-containing protein [Nevskia sp.]
MPPDLEPGHHMKIFRPRHRAAVRLGRLLLGLGLIGSGLVARADDAPLKSIAILDFELIDDQKDTVPDTVIAPRLPTVSAQIREAFAKEGLYRVVDNAPAAAMMAAFKQTQEFRTCNGCELDVARALGADRVALGWVQKVSNLILNLNLQIEDAKTGEVLLNKSVDLRGNTDTSFRRGIDYLVRSMLDRHQGNR